MTTDTRIEQAALVYERAIFGGDADAVSMGERDLDAVEADLALARGRLVHARFMDDHVENARELELFERAAELYAQLGDIRGEGEALFWVGTFHQVVRNDGEMATPALTRSLDLATKVDDRLTMSHALGHLGIAEYMAGNLETAREHFEVSVRLRRELGYLPGVAANLIPLAQLAAQDGRRDDAAALLKEATELAESTQSSGVLRWVAEAKQRLDMP